MKRTELTSVSTFRTVAGFSFVSFSHWEEVALYNCKIGCFMSLTALIHVRIRYHPQPSLGTRPNWPWKRFPEPTGPVPLLVMVKVKEIGLKNGLFKPDELCCAARQQTGTLTGAQRFDGRFSCR